MIQTKAIIIAATVNTMRYSIYLPRCLTADEIGTSAFVCSLRSRHPTHGWPQRSQLRPARASLSRTVATADVNSFNISLAVWGSSLNKGIGFIESLLVRLNVIAVATARLSVCWLLLCKNCVAILRRIPATDAVFSKDFVNAQETCCRHNCCVCGFERGR